MLLASSKCVSGNAPFFKIKHSISALWANEYKNLNNSERGREQILDNQNSAADDAREMAEMPVVIGIRQFRRLNAWVCYLDFMLLH